MPWRSVWMDDDDGPQAFSSVKFGNQVVWDNHPDQAAAVMCDAINAGGFGSDHIDRTVGNYEGQIMAIRAGLAAKGKHGWYITDLGREFLRKHGRAVPTFLTALDSWHTRPFEYCVWDVERNGEPMLKFAEKLYPRISVGMEPLFRREDVLVLRDYLSEWLVRTADYERKAT